MATDIADLVNEGRKIVERVGREKTSISLLQRELHLPFPQAKELLLKLHEAGYANVPLARRRGPGRPSGSIATAASARRIRAEALGSQPGDREYYTRAKELVIQRQRVSGHLLEMELHIARPRCLRILQWLENEGVIGPPQGSFTRREVLVRASPNSQQRHAPRNVRPRAPAASPVLRERPDLHARIRRLDLLVHVVGSGELATLLEEVIADLEELERLEGHTPMGHGS